MIVKRSTCCQYRFLWDHTSRLRQDGLDGIPSNSFDIVILDEAQRIKNRDSTTALACRLLPRKYSWALSATPVENDTRDVASILGFLDPSIRFDLLSGTGLTEKLKTMMLRRRKAEVRDELPPVIVQDLKLELTPSQRARYDELWANRREAVASSTKGTRALLLGLITRLKITCNTDGETSSKTSGLEGYLRKCGEYKSYPCLLPIRRDSEMDFG